MELDGCLMLCFVWKLIINCTHWRNYAQLAGHFWSFLPCTLWEWDHQHVGEKKQPPCGGFRKWGVLRNPSSQKTILALKSMVTWGSLPYLRTPPCEPWHLPLSQPFCSASCRSSLPGIIDDTYQFDEYDEYGNHVVHDVVLDVGGVGWCLGGGADIYIYAGLLWTTHFYMYIIYTE